MVRVNEGAVNETQDETDEDAEEESDGFHTDTQPATILVFNHCTEYSWQFKRINVGGFYLQL